MTPTRSSSLIFSTGLAIVALMASLLAAPRPAVASTSSGPALGVQSHVLWSGQTDDERMTTLDMNAAMGAEWVRIDLGWCSLEETGSGQVSAWYLNRADRMVDAARARGLKVLLTLWCTPGWANGGQGTHVPPVDVDEYARVARYVATHFRGRVAAWEVWNEPNLSGFWAPKDPVSYTKLLRAAYPAFKAGDPAATVVFGAPAHNDVDFIRGAYDAGARGHFDAMGTHPYQGMGDEAPELPHEGKWYRFTAVELVRDLMVQRGDGDVPIWFTEFGWSSHANTGSEPNWQRGVTEQQQADYLVRALEHTRAHYPYVTHAIVYNDRAKNTTDIHQLGYGLMRRDFTPKPAYRALADYQRTRQPAPEPAPQPAPEPAPQPAPEPAPQPAPEPAPEPAPQPAPAAPVQLHARAYVVNGSPRVELTWQGATTARVEVRRWTGAVTAEPTTSVAAQSINRVRNTGTYTDVQIRKGQNSFTYTVCEVGASGCSAPVHLSF